MSPDVSGQMFRIRELIQGLAAVDDPARNAARELVRAVLEVHRAALAKLLATMARDSAGYAACLADDLVASLLALHDLHPDPLAVRVERALGQVRSGLPTGATIGLVAADERRIRVRVVAPVESLAGARRAVEEALCRAAPDCPSVQIEDGDGRLSLPVLSDLARGAT
jgi:hypothetical protein